MVVLFKQHVRKTTKEQKEIKQYKSINYFANIS